MEINHRTEAVSLRYLKRVVFATLVYTAFYLIFIAVLQALTGYDYTAAYGVGGLAGIAEMALCGIIKITELKEIKKHGPDGDNKRGTGADIGADNGISDTLASDEDHRGPGGAAE